jgi:DNA-binding NarL/FixJ family response regulator
MMSRARVLVVDDNELLLNKVVALLASSFDVVGSARNGQEMISEAGRLNPEVIVADIAMPVLTGIEAAHQLPEAGSGAKIVFLTIHTETEFVEACCREAAVGYVIKSHMKTDLIPAIDAAVQGCSFFFSGLAPQYS